MTATGTGSGELRERLALALGQAIGLSPEREIEWMPVTRTQADTAISVLAPAGGTLTPDVRVAVERMVDGLDTGDDRNVVRRWLGRAEITPKECPTCKGVGFIPEYEADAGYRMGYHQVGESRCGRCGGDGVIMESDD